MAEKRGIKITAIITILSLIIVLIVLAYSFFYAPKCQNAGCFKKVLWECDKASFMSEEANSTWFYRIDGMSFGECRIYVKAVSLKADVETGTALQGKDMTCYVPKQLLGAFMPEEKIEYCHGILKEEIQRLMIEKMHLYIIQNIGQFNKTSVV